MVATMKIMKPTDKLDKALFEARVENAERSRAEIISRALDVPIEIVHRVVFAWTLVETVNGHQRYVLNDDWPLSQELSDAIRHAVLAGHKRYTVRRALETGRSIGVRTSALVPEDHKGIICHGCPNALTCVATNYSTPEKCYTAIDLLQVKPERIVGDYVDVEAPQPRGKHRIPLTAVDHLNILRTLT